MLSPHQQARKDVGVRCVSKALTKSAWGGGDSFILINMEEEGDVKMYEQFEEKSLLCHMRVCRSA